MPGLNLTRAEAQQRAALIDVDRYDVRLDLTTSPTHFASRTSVHFRAHAGAETFADLAQAEINRITLNGQDLDPAQVYADHRITLTDLADHNELVVEATMAYSRTGEGLHRFVDPADDRVYLYTQFEVPDARRVFTTFEQPDLKAVFTFTVIAPQHWKVISNTVATTTPVGADVAEWQFAPTERMSTYITALVAGEYAEVRDTYHGAHGDIPLGHYCRQSLVDHFDTEELVELTKQGFAFFEAAFAFPYPFGKYDQCYVPEYNMGAMENAGCVTFRDEYLPRSKQTRAFYEQRANTILHEMAHMWFGDLVTMKWWDDLWLNESFAEWAAHHASAEATQYTEAWTGFTNARKNWAYRQDQLPSTHPIAADNHDLEAVEVNFDGITYAKGASTLKQLVAWVGEEPFLAGLREYFKAHAFGNSEFQDLLSALEAASGRELSAWAAEWLQTSGVNTLQPSFTLDEHGAYAGFAVEQSAHPDYPTLRRHRIGIGLYDVVDGVLTLRESIEVDVEGASTRVPHLDGVAQADLLLLNDRDLTYAKIRLDQRSLATLLAKIDTLGDSLARALCWGAAWDMTRDGEMPASDFVQLVLQGVGTETDLTAVGALLRYAKSALDTYVHPSRRTELSERWQSGLGALLDDAAPGSDHQLALARSYAVAATTSQNLDRLEALLDGAEELPGLALDQDLRWGLMTALCAQGRYGQTQIDAELASDQTIAGQERAAAARAAMPTPEAKAWAWEQAVERDDVPNETQRQICAAFQWPGQADVLRAYIPRYLSLAETIWEAKGVQRSRVTLEFLFPRGVTDRETLAAVDAWLATTSANPAAQRYVEEGRADLVRALDAQERDRLG